MASPRAIPNSHRQVVVWQGWRMELPARWYPLKLEGNRNAGYALFADMLRARLGVKWSTPRGARQGKSQEVRKHIATRMIEEVGKLAAEEAKDFAMPGGWEHSRLYAEPHPPGRDVWMGYSPVSGRVCELVYHANRRDRALENAILPKLHDEPADQAMPWSIFEWSCAVPPDMPLLRQQLHAGDLSLTFAGKGRELTIRQLAVARIALNKRPLDKWLAVQQRIHRKTHRPMEKPSEVELPIGENVAKGLFAMMRRRWRYGFATWHPARLATFALHDAARDRLVLSISSDRELAERAIATLGWAARPPAVKE